MKVIIFFILMFFVPVSLVYSQDTVSSTINIDEKNVVFNKVEVEPSPKEKSSWEKFLRKHIDYDTPAFNGAPRGVYEVVVRFVVLTDGKLGNFEALTNKGFGMEREVIKALKKSPPWKPAIQNGKPVNATRIQKVTFDVDY